MRKKMIFLSTIAVIVMLFLLATAPNATADYKFNYTDYSEMVTILEDLEAQSSLQTPDVYSLNIIGYSLQGNPIYAVKFSDTPELEEDGEPDVVFDAGIHANEWLPVESTINFIQYLFDVYYDDQHADHAEVTDLVDNFEIWILPMLNPDGRIRDDLSGGDPESFWTDTSYHADDSNGWRMNLQTVNCPSMPSGTNQGIDLNRNWSYKFWEYSDCTETRYNGGYALTAPETQVLKQFINNHMVSLLYHQHSAIGALFSNSGDVGLGSYLCDEMNAVYEEDGLLDPLLELFVLHGGYGAAGAGIRLLQEQSNTSTGSFLASGYCDGSGQTGQYYNWLWFPVACPLAPDVTSRRSIQCVFYEYPVLEGRYGHPSEGKIGQNDPGDASNYFHLSSGDTAEWIIGRSLEMNKYFIKQSQYPFSPRYFTDMSRKPEAPETDLAIVGAKISEVGTGLPGCFTFGSDGRDLIDHGPKRVTWNVQNNGTSLRTIGSEITICNLTDDPGCSSPTNAILTRVDVPPETIETFTYDYDFVDSGACRDYSVTLTTGESNEFDNDLKIFVFTVVSADDTDCDGTADLDDNCAEMRNGPVAGTCTSGAPGTLCRGDEWCGPIEDPGICSMNQEDTYPPQGNDIGDACDCEGNFDGDQDVDADDVTTFLVDFGRGTYFEPCDDPLYDTCNGDFACDTDVDADDVTKFLEDFGRGTYFNPCPTPSGGPWCVY